VPTRNRPEQLHDAVRAILAQSYPGSLRALVVVDGPDPDQAAPDMASIPGVDVVTNERRAGLAGARNTGILAATADLVAFCDDDDVWLPGKLQRQISALCASPAANFATCAIQVEYRDRRNARLAGTQRVTHNDLLHSRMAMLHSSTFVARRVALRDVIGLVDEDAPAGQNEDWDLLLRAARDHPLVHVDEPLVRVMWSAGSYFAHDWDTKITSLEWMLRRHPEIATDAVGAGRVYGQIAFWHATMRRRQPAVRWALRAARSSPREPRAYLALAVAAGLPSSVVLDALHRRGHGV
jgi:glycosyltransferase involved in cell wall biosynthesis